MFIVLEKAIKRKNPSAVHWNPSLYLSTLQRYVILSHSSIFSAYFFVLWERYGTFYCWFVAIYVPVCGKCNTFAENYDCGAFLFMCPCIGSAGVLFLPEGQEMENG